MSIHRLILCFACAALFSMPLLAQDSTPSEEPNDTAGQASESAKEAGDTEEAEDVTNQPEDVVEDAKEKVDEFAQQVNESEEGKEISAGILQPIYALAEQMSFPMFHWIAFAIMATGVVSYALQLVLTKLALLMRASLSLSEVFSDALGLVISVVGLVLTTQAAAENSTFTQSPFAVISASAAGVIVGFIFFRWGHVQETQALKGRKVERLGNQK